MEEKINFNHSVIIEDRKKLNLSGVKDCLGFDDETIVLNTALGKLTIKGTALHIENFDTNTGDFTATGRVHAIVYTAQQNSGGFLSRIFK